VPEPTPDSPLRLYGAPAEQPALAWSWVATQLREAGTYWVVAASAGHPHPRPVWGVWHDDGLALSIGGPVLAAALETNPECTVHLDSGTDVVVVEGIARRGAGPDPEAIAAYDRKYDWQYDVAEYGPFTYLVPTVVLAWRAAGWAGREGFQQVGRWRFR
jgi:hypothetical protein